MLVLYVMIKRKKRERQREKGKENLISNAFSKSRPPKSQPPASLQAIPKYLLTAYAAHKNKNGTLKNNQYYPMGFKFIPPLC